MAGETYQIKITIDEVAQRIAIRLASGDRLARPVRYRSVDGSTRRLPPPTTLGPGCRNSRCRWATTTASSQRRRCAGLLPSAASVTSMPSPLE